MTAVMSLELTKGIKERFITVTVDNGREFAGHEKITSKLGIDVYFAHPYHSWERGLSENVNGLIGQYLPKKTDFREIFIKRCNTTLLKLIEIFALVS